MNKTTKNGKTKKAKIRWLHLLAALALGTALTAMTSQLSVADDDDDDYSEEVEHLFGTQGKSRMDIVYRQLAPMPQNAKFKTECSSCHLLYHPGLLPTRSWNRIMQGLEKHFGENASLDTATAGEIRAILVANSADKAKSRRSRKIAASIPASETPIRISELRYFKRKHHEIRAAVWKRQKVGSRANCMACHREAEKGYFSEDTVKIPK